MAASISNELTTSKHGQRHRKEISRRHLGKGQGWLGKGAGLKFILLTKIFSLDSAVVTPQNMFISALKKEVVMDGTLAQILSSNGWHSDTLF